MHKKRVLEMTSSDRGDEKPYPVSQQQRSGGRHLGNAQTFIRRMRFETSRHHGNVKLRPTGQSRQSDAPNFRREWFSEDEFG
ncbi:hypothetical protein CEXT_731221 [Caerostris extrusa]|uniref:Uncharacterized protein n=1 Tax=Caerostris extrusa TaxID=172846 RepID=A0AAV4VZ04_CAEEX|nr:hypothetical protein CEXT_731221 [Caerostris extrusa]